MFIGPLARLGVAVRYASPSIAAEGQLDRHQVDRLVGDRVDRLVAEVETADVVVFRRAYATHALCLECDFAALEGERAAAHVRATGHAVDAAPHLAVRRLFELLEEGPGGAPERAIVYETDDDLLRPDSSNAQARVLRHEHDLIERMLRRADLVTTSTPVLARRLAPLATTVQVVRNAVDSTWYGDPAPLDPTSDGDGDGDGDGPRVVYYGSLGRLRDYAVCAPAVNEIAAGARGARRVWVGAPELAAISGRVADLFDEIHPYVSGVPAFARQLSLLRPAIGLAPLAGSWFDRGKSELHWLEYSMAGAATVATRMPGGPYDVIRDGVDGYLAKGPAEWRSILNRLAGSAELRAEVAAQARARVVAEYDVEVRAIEWANAYRWAAEHAGSGLEHSRAHRRSHSRSHGAAAPHSGGTRTETATPPGAPADDGVFAAYVAAQAFADRSPLLLRLGVNGSASGQAAGQGDSQGPDSASWVTIDTAGEPDLRHDVAFGLPFGDGSVEVVDARHVLDTPGGNAAVLAVEAARVLQPGGLLRILTGDRAAAINRQRTLNVQGIWISGHDARLPVFTSEALEQLLRQAGFADVRRLPADEGELLFEAIR